MPTRRSSTRAWLTAIAAAGVAIAVTAPPAHAQTRARHLTLGVERGRHPLQRPGFSGARSSRRHASPNSSVGNPNGVPQPASILSISPVDSSNVWTAGQDLNNYSGVILATSDGGAHWHDQPVPLDVVGLEAIDMVSTSTGYAVGVDVNGNGVVVATTDGGAHWSDQSLPSGTGPLFSVQFTGASDGWAVGTDPGATTGVVLHTTNGGTTWSAVPANGSTGTGPDFGVSAVSGAVTVVGCSDSGCNVGDVLESTNAGSSWAIATLGSFIPDSASRTSATNAWIVGNDYSTSPPVGKVYHTTAATATYTQQALPGTPDQQLLSVTAIDSSTAWTAGYDAATATYARIFKTTDGGTTWTLLTNANGLPPVSQIAATSASDVWAGADVLDQNGNISYGDIAHSTDGGTNWTSLPFVHLGEETGGYTLDAYGGIHPFGTAPELSVSTYFPGWNIMRGMDVEASGAGGFTADGYGGVHPFGDAHQEPVTSFFGGWDIVRGISVAPNGAGGYVVDGWGGLHPFGSSPEVPVQAYWQGWDIVRGVVVAAGGASGYTLDAWGGIHPFGGAPGVGVTAYWPGQSLARGITLLPNGHSGFTLDAFGGVHPFGGAPQLPVSQYTPGQDIFRGIVARSDGLGGYTIDCYGNVYEFGDAPPPNVPTNYAAPIINGGGMN